MDYSTGAELLKYQWDFIHDPEGGWYLWEDSEEGATINVAQNLIEKIKEANETNAENIDISDFYKDATNPSYSATVTVNEQQIPLYISQKLYSGQHKIFPLKEDVHGPDSLSDGLYRRKIEFEEFDVYLKIQTKTSKEIEILFEYMFGQI